MAATVPTRWPVPRPDKGRPSAAAGGSGGLAIGCSCCVDLLCRAAELAAVAQHAMENDRELPGHGDGGLPGADPPRQTRPPGLQHRPARDAIEDDPGRLGVPSVEADHGQTQLPQLVPVPGRQGTALQTDAHRLGRPRADGRCDRLWGGGALAFPDHLAAAIDDTDRGLLLRDVQPDILFHACSPQWVRWHQTPIAAGGHRPAITPCQLVRPWSRGYAQPELRALAAMPKRPRR